MADIIVTGGEGQLGFELVRQLEERGESVEALGRGECDITSLESVAEAFAQYSPKYVFNAAAYNAVDQAENETDAAFAVNAMGPANLAAACREAGAKLVHFSTDYVFGDGFAEPIDESQPAEPLSAYGRSKLFGEELVARNHRSSFVVRSTALYSHRRSNFVRTMLKYGLAGKPLTVVNDQYISPTWVRPLARAAIELSQTEVFGTYHAVTHGGCTWYEFARLIFDILDVDAELGHTTQEEWGAEARRPQYSMLDNRLLRLAGLDEFADYRVTLESFLDEYGDQLVSEFSE